MLAAVSLIALLAMVAFAIDVGFIVLVRTQLQTAADSAAMAGASQLGQSSGAVFQTADRYAGYHTAGGHGVALLPEDVEIGVWDSATRTFTPAEQGNAVRVTTRRDTQHGGEAPLFFARALNRDSFTMQAQAVAMANPRDIAFVVDLSGSMNDDAEPVWATDVINATFASEGYPTVGTDLMQQLYDDFGFGRFPGHLEYLGQPFGVPENTYAYAELTKDGGVLARRNVPNRYRIEPGDSEIARKHKAYAAIIDYQLARLMPAAKPTPDSRTNYAYWEKYLDYVIQPQRVQGSPGSGGPTPPGGPPAGPPPGRPPEATPPDDPPPRGNRGNGNDRNNNGERGNDRDRGRGRGRGRHATTSTAPRLSPKPPNSNPLTNVFTGPGAGWPLAAWLWSSQGTPPYSRGYLPPRQDTDRIDRFNNPNRSTFPQATSSLPRRYRNRLGYLTYVQFMMDHGRDLKPDGSSYVPLSRHSPHCPWHREDTAGGTFSFPPREQPTHAARRALIAALQVIKERNESIGNPRQRDWVSIVSFDLLSGGGPVVAQSLTADYGAAMERCTTLQACGDKGASTATEAGLITAREHIKSYEEGGQGRVGTNKIVVLLTDGVPNLYVSNPREIDRFIRGNRAPEFYGTGAYAYDAALMQAAKIQKDNWYLFPVGVGLGTDYGFMDRLARLGGTANDHGRSPRGSGNPAEYEQRLTDIFREIIESPKVRLVQ